MKQNKNYFDSLPDDPAPVTLSVSHRLCFSEADPLGIAWHGNYPRFFESAQTELGRKIGITFETLRAAMLATPVAKIHVDYLRPLFYDDLFTITATLFWCEGPRLNTQYEIRLENGVLTSRGYTIQLFMDVATREPLWLSPPILEQCRTRWKEGAFYA